MPFGYRRPMHLHDAQRAIRSVRVHSDEQGISLTRIGTTGPTAGGYLTAMAETSFDSVDPGAAGRVDRASRRPDSPARVRHQGIQRRRVSTPSTVTVTRSIGVGCGHWR